MRQKYQVEFGPGTLFLGFRSPEDQVYDRLVQKALAVGALTEAKVAYSSGWKDSADHAGYCGHVNGLVRAEAEFIWEHLQAGGITYLCGGARTFGAAVERELLEILQERGNLDFDEASAYLRRLVEHGKLLEDLAD
jgi:NADPH-ferrihemoprotein reductase